MAGIYLSFYLPFWYWLCLPLMGLMMALIGKTGQKRRPFWWMLGFAVLFVCVGWLRGSLALAPAFVWPEEGWIEGDIKQVAVYDQTAYVLLEQTRVGGEGGALKLRVIVEAQAVSQARPGDRFSGYANALYATGTNNALENMQRIASGKSQTAKIQAGTAIVEPKAVSLRYAPARLQQMLSARMDRLFQDQAGLIKGMVLGDSAGLPEEVYQAYTRVGVLHILSVSGLHVGFLAAVMALLLERSRLKRLTKTSLTLALIWGYCLLCGAPSAAVRAAVMTSVALVNRQMGRRVDVWNTLSASAMIVLLVSPMQLYMPGFLLSFGAMWGIICLAGPVARLCKGPRALKESVGLSVAAQLGVWPLEASFFHTMSTMALLGNLFVVPLSSLIPIAALATVACSLLVWPAAVGMAFFIKGWSLLMTTAVQWLAALPFAQLTMPGWPYVAALCYWVAMFFLSPYCLWKKRYRRLGALFCLGLAVVQWIV